MTRSISAFVFLLVSLVTSCGQAPAGKKLIDEINAAQEKARQVVALAESKRKEATQKDDNKAEHDKLIDEAARLFGQAAATLEEAAKKAEELGKLPSPAWYAEYFGLHSKRFSNLAKLGANAHDELLQ